jgi:hypothetical protein
MKIIVRTQTELEVAFKNLKPSDQLVCIEGKFALSVGMRVEAWGNSSVVARENSSVEAWENSSVEAWGNSSVEAWGNSSVEAWGNSSVEARENSSVEAWGNSSVEAWGNSSVEAWGNSSVEARGNSSVVARENSSVEARGNSSVEAWGNVFIRLFAALKITASVSVIISRQGNAKKIEGGTVLERQNPDTPEKWCQFYGVEINAGVVILYKALNEDFTSDWNKFLYATGSIPIAPDWDGGAQECGGGLHFSPRPKFALSFKANAKRLVGCPVKLSDISVHPNGDYPQKVKARGCCGPVFEVDRNGNRIDSNEQPKT